MPPMPSPPRIDITCLDGMDGIEEAIVDWDDVPTCSERFDSLRPHGRPYYIHFTGKLVDPPRWEDLNPDYMFPPGYRTRCKLTVNILFEDLADAEAFYFDHDKLTLCGLRW